MPINQDTLNNIISGLESMPKKSEIDTASNDIDVLATADHSGLMSAEDKVKLDDLSENGTYVHPTTSGYKHIPAGGVEGQILKWESDGTAKWATNAEYGYATTTSGGLMSASDKTNLDAAVDKLSGIATGANKYVLPTASSTTLGGVKTTSSVTDTTGLIACPIINGVPYYMNTVGNYTLPTASSTTLGGVKTTSTVTSTSDLTACPIIAGVPYYKDTNTTYSEVTTSAAGLMSASDKIKLNNVSSTYALKSKYGDTTIDVGRYPGATTGKYSTAEGYYTTASGNYSHAEGYYTTASGNYSHAEGYSSNIATLSTSNDDIITAWTTSKFSLAKGVYSHAEGYNVLALGNYSHAEGCSTIATDSYSHVEGYGTTSVDFGSHTCGKWNVEVASSGSPLNRLGIALVVGNGVASIQSGPTFENYSDITRSNAFSVQYNGIVKAASTITASTTADYAEFFEWLDENPNNEDRVGYFVTLDGDKIKIASNKDDYILGIISGEPFVLGNGDCDTWNGMYLRDEFRRTIYEPAPKVIEVDNGFKVVEGEYEGTRPKLNPDYDNTQKYISRFDRKEWAPVGMLGVLAVRHDGTAEVNGYVTVNENGIATACEKTTENSYRVIKSNSDSVVEIIFR